MKASKSKTFQKGDDFSEVIHWITSEDCLIEVNDYIPEGTASYGDGLAPHDPVVELKHKYIVTVTKIEP